MQNNEQALQNEIVNTKAQAFNVINSLTNEKTQLGAAVGNLENILKNVVGILELAEPHTPDAIFAEVARLKELDVKYPVEV